MRQVSIPSWQLKERVPLAVEVPSLTGVLPVLLVRFEGRVFAVENRCPHKDRPLTEGEVVAAETGAVPQIICPFHGAAFCLETGAVMQPPAYTDLATYSVVEQEGMITVFV